MKNILESNSNSIFFDDFFYIFDDSKNKIFIDNTNFFFDSEFSFSLIQKHEDIFPDTLHVFFNPFNSFNHLLKESNYSYTNKVIVCNPVFFSQLLSEFTDCKFILYYYQFDLKFLSCYLLLHDKFNFHFHNDFLIKNDLFSYPVGKVKNIFSANSLLGLNSKKTSSYDYSIKKLYSRFDYVSF